VPTKASKQLDTDILKKRVFLGRSTQGSIDPKEKTGMQRGLETRYTVEQMGSLEAKCSKMILDCVAWDSKGLDFLEVGKMYDMLYSIYCAKLNPEGQDFNRERDLRDWVRETHRTRNMKPKPSGEQLKHYDDDDLIWIIFMGLTCLCTIVYYICLYFCLTEETTVDENEMRRKVKDAKQR
jgi:hypothetical protein